MDLIYIYISIGQQNLSETKKGKTVREMEILDDYPVILGKNIQYLRKQKGLSRNALAKMLGISPSTLKNLEEGVLGKLMRVSVLVKAADIFGYTPQVLLEKRLEDSEQL